MSSQDPEKYKYTFSKPIYFAKSGRYDNSPMYTNMVALRIDEANNTFQIQRHPTLPQPEIENLVSSETYVNVEDAVNDIVTNVLNIQPGAGASQLELITEITKTGWRLLGVDPASYGDIGEGAVDLSIQTSPSTTAGATGETSFASGIDTTSSGKFSHSEGNGAVAEGESSHAEGEKTYAKADVSHAEGRSNRADGVVSHVGGEANVAGSYAETVIGSFSNTMPGNTTTFDASNPQFRVGIGESSITRRDGFRVYKSGDVMLNQYPEARVDGMSMNSNFLSTDGEGRIKSNAVTTIATFMNEYNPYNGAPLTNADLEAFFPGVPTWYRIYLPNLAGGGMVYTKIDSFGIWVQEPISFAP